MNLHLVKGGRFAHGHPTHQNQHERGARAIQIHLHQLAGVTLAKSGRIQVGKGRPSPLPPPRLTIENLAQTQFLNNSTKLNSIIFRSLPRIFKAHKYSEFAFLAYYVVLNSRAVSIIPCVSPSVHLMF